MNKNYISLNEINLDTLVDYVDKTVIESGNINTHASALRDYYFNSNIDFIINNKLKEVDYNKFILCIDSIYTSDSSSGTLDEGNAKYTVKIKTQIDAIYAAERPTTLPDNITPELVFGGMMDKDNNKYYSQYMKLLDLVEVIVLNNEIFSVKVLGKDNGR